MKPPMAGWISAGIVMLVIGWLPQTVTVNGRIMSLSSCSTMWQW